MNDRKLMIVIVGAMGLIALLGEIVLHWRILDSLNDSKVSGTELAVIVGAAGALGNLVTGVIGWFAPSPLSKSTTDTQDVNVVNTPSDPVPVTEPTETET